MLWQDTTEATLAPQDIAEKVAREKLYNLEVSLRASLSALPATNSKAAHTQYLETVHNLSAARRRPSPRFRFGVVLSALAAIQLATLLWTLLVYILTRTSPQDEFADSLLLVTGSLTTWLLLHPYSEWYENLGDYEVVHDPTWIISAVLTLTVIAFTLILTAKPGSSRLIVISINTGVASLVAVLAKFEPAWLVAAATAFSGLAWPFQFCIYVLVSLFVAGGVWFGFPTAAQAIAGSS